MDYKQQAIDLFINHTEYKNEDIKKIKDIHLGYTNQSFLFVLNNKQKYQVRISQETKIVDREYENKVLPLIKDKINFIYLDQKGNAIKKWIEGRNPKFIFNKKQLLNKLIKTLFELHSIDISKSDLGKQDYYVYINEQLKQDYPVWTQLYLDLLEKHKNLELVLSHNDVHPLNMLYTKKTKEIVLIDFEWTQKNYRYFDLGGFFAISHLKEKWLKYIAQIYPNIDYSILLDFAFIVAFFAFQFQAKDSKKLKKFKNFTLKRTKYIYQIYLKYNSNK